MTLPIFDLHCSCLEWLTAIAEWLYNSLLKTMDNGEEGFPIEEEVIIEGVEGEEMEVEL